MAKWPNLKFKTWLKEIEAIKFSKEFVLDHICFSVKRVFAEKVFGEQNFPKLFSATKCLAIFF